MTASRPPHVVQQNVSSNMYDMYKSYVRTATTRANQNALFVPKLNNFDHAYPHLDSTNISYMEKSVIHMY